MLPTSGTFNFQSIQIELIIREAYERIGILGEFVEPQKLDSAKRSIDLLLLDWMNKSVNLWTLKTDYLGLVTGQGQYTLSETVSDVFQVNLRTSTRQVIAPGTPESSPGGIATYAFDGNPATACTQTAANGYISYNYGVQIPGVSYIVVTSQVTRQYTLSIETSQDNITWTLLQNVAAANYNANTKIRIDIPGSIPALAYRIRETGGQLLNIQELYFNNSITASSSGSAGYAFDGNPLTSCNQDPNQNGSISYDYGVGNTQQINFIGITSQVTRNYSIRIDTSIDNATWTLLQTLPAQSFSANVNYWFDIVAPINARAYRIIETNGNILNIQELYFNNNVLDMPISNVSKDEYLTYPNKKLQARPSVYYLDRTIIPTLNIWATPSNLYNCIQYSYKKMMQDAGGFYSYSLEIPSRFYPALIWGLSYQLALKFNPQQSQVFKAEYEESFSIATKEDSESVNISIYGDTSYYEE